METDPELIESIAPDVLKVLARMKFFQMLDDRMCPTDDTERLQCQGTHAISTTVMAQLGFDPDEISEIAQVLSARGGCCDCEILFNVAEESRLKSEYWKAKAVQTSQPGSLFEPRPHGTGIY